MADILTQHNNNQRTGEQLGETILSPTSLTTLSLRRRFDVDGAIYAQPLVFGGKVYVATTHNVVYAFDPSSSNPLWRTPLDARASFPSVQIPCSDLVLGWRGNIVNFFDEIGIISTPVIDSVAGVIYVVALGRPSAGFVEHRIFALDTNTGAILGWQTILDNNFSSSSHMQRPGVLLVAGRLYIAFGSLQDSTPYHGAVFCYSVQRSGAAVTISELSVFFSGATTSDECGIWMAGGGLAADDAGNVHFMVGNGTFNAAAGSYGSSFVKLDPNCNRLDFFCPSNQAHLSAIDADVGSGGVLLVRRGNGGFYVVGGGKQGKVYVLDANNMGGYRPPYDGGGNGGDSTYADPNPSNPAQAEAVVDERELIDQTNRFGHHIHSSPAWHNNRFFVWPEYEPLMGISLDANGKIGGTILTGDGDPTIPNKGMPGGMLTVSASTATDDTSAIVWANHPAHDPVTRSISNANFASVRGTLYAFGIDLTATPPLKRLWTSQPGDVGYFAKFAPPTVCDGRVLLPTFGGDMKGGAVKHDLPGYPTPTSAPVLCSNDSILAVAYAAQSSIVLGAATEDPFTGALIWSNPVILPNRAVAPGTGPAIAITDQWAYLMWIEGGSTLHVERSPLPFNSQSWLTIGLPSPYTPDLAKSWTRMTPALLYQPQTQVRARLYMAWIGTGAPTNGINVWGLEVNPADGSLTASLPTWSVLNWSSSTGPKLAWSIFDELCLLWRDDATGKLAIARTDSTSSLSFSDTSPVLSTNITCIAGSAPAMVKSLLFSMSPSSNGDPHISLMRVSPDQWPYTIGSSNFNFGDGEPLDLWRDYTNRMIGLSSPSAAIYKGQVYVAWQGPFGVPVACVALGQLLMFATS